MFPTKSSSVVTERGEEAPVAERGALHLGEHERLAVDLFLKHGLKAASTFLDWNALAFYEARHRCAIGEGDYLAALGELGRIKETLERSDPWSTLRQSPSSRRPGIG